MGVDNLKINSLRRKTFGLILQETCIAVVRTVNSRVCSFIHLRRHGGITNSQSSIDGSTSAVTFAHTIKVLHTALCTPRERHPNCTVWWHSTFQNQTHIHSTKYNFITNLQGHVTLYDGTDWNKITAHLKHVGEAPNYGFSNYNRRWLWLSHLLCQTLTEWRSNLSVTGVLSIPWLQLCRSVLFVSNSQRKIKAMSVKGRSLRVKDNLSLITTTFLEINFSTKKDLSVENQI